MARILLAEADRDIRRFIAGILADCGHSVKSCADVAEAAQSLATREIDVVVTDLVLDLEGETVLGRDCAALGIPTVTLSGGKFRLDQSLDERPFPLVEKPFRVDDLRGVLDAVGSGESDRGTQIAAPPAALRRA